jgi:hypothetical protein
VATFGSRCSKSFSESHITGSGESLLSQASIRLNNN